METNDPVQSSRSETVGPAVGGESLARVAALTTAHATPLWIAVLAGLVLDSVLTVYGIHLGLAERNPVAADLIANVGVVPALALLKGAALAVGVGGWVLLPERYRGLVPAGLAVPWVGAAVANALTIGLALT
jgi:hypothetical protein